ncbi:taste receptor type 2 member 39-like [Mantella aurantiaca]
MSSELYTPSQLPYIIVLILEIIIGLLMNAFITFVIYHDFLKTKTLSSSYKIMVGLASSNVCFGILMLIGLFDYFCSLGIFTTIFVNYIYLYLLLYTFSFCMWLTSSLGFFYFIKISNFESGLFSWVKKNIGSIVPWMILVDLLVSLFNSFLSSLLFIFSQSLSRNTTQIPSSMVSKLSQSGMTIINAALVNTSLPFSVIVLTTLLTLVELKKHGNTMKNVQTSDSERLRSYEKVVCRMTQSLCFYGIFYAVMFIFYLVVSRQVESGFWLLLLVLNSFTPVQSVLLVLANPKLRATWKGIFLCGHLQEMLST